MKKLKRLNLPDQNQPIINFIGLLVAIFGFLILNIYYLFSEKDIDSLATELHFKSIAISFVLLSFSLRNKIIIGNTIFAFFVYHLVDEILGNACKINKFEFIFEIILIISAILEYVYKNSNNNNDNN